MFAAQEIGTDFSSISLEEKWKTHENKRSTCSG